MPGATPVHAAAFNGQLQCALVLVEEGADVTITDNDNFTAADQAELW
jgi:ankyrin repeat protein